MLGSFLNPLAGNNTSAGPIENMLDDAYKVPRDVLRAFPRVSTPYRMVYKNWYKSIPYSFSIRIPSENPGQSNAWTDRWEKYDKNIDYFFPIHPENITIDTPFAVNVTPTIGGVVEEHSGAVFYNIRISGTTGIISDIDITTGLHVESSKQRTKAFKKPLLGSLGGFLGSTAGLVNSAIAGITGLGDKLIKGKVNKTSGYTAFHVLYKYLWLYHFSKSHGTRGELIFCNSKDNNQYKVVVENFQLVRDKSEPHLYRYSISLKGWSLEYDRVNGAGGPSAQDLKKRMEDLGLGEETSLKAKAQRLVRAARSVLTAATSVVTTAAQDSAIL